MRVLLFHANTGLFYQQLRLLSTKSLRTKRIAPGMMPVPGAMDHQVYFSAVWMAF